MVNTAIQLYTVRNLDRSLPDILRLAADAGYDGVEFAVLVGDADHDAVRATLDETGLHVASAHVGIGDIEESFETTVETYRALGCDTLVVPWLGSECFESESAVLETSTRLDELAERLAERDLRLLYHNHDHEFTDLAGTTGMELLIEETAHVDFQLDIGWVAAADHDPAAVLERYPDRFPSIHVTDVDAVGGSSTEVGEGITDIEGAIQAARGQHVEWLVYEYDDPTDGEASLRHGASFLATLR